jgi:hypothetical protein
MYRATNTHNSQLDWKVGAALATNGVCGAHTWRILVCQIDPAGANLLASAYRSDRTIEYRLPDTTSATMARLLAWWLRASS